MSDAEPSLAMTKAVLEEPSREFQLPLSLLKDHIEVLIDGLAGGNFNNELIRLVFYTDKPFMADKVVRSARVQSATLIMRRS